MARLRITTSISGEGPASSPLNTLYSLVELISQFKPSFMATYNATQKHCVVLGEAIEN